MEEPSTSPKVFLCHATEDKERFVLAFARKLRERGIDAWLDKWEIQPGDSLVDKIFEEGLKFAEAIIIVVSANSVAKKWVREELDVSVVNRIKRGTRLIPVVLDDSEVPEALKATRWVRIRNLNNYESELGEIVAAVFGITDKPALGDPPSYTRKNITIPGTSQQDAFVLSLFCEAALKRDDRFGIDTDEVALLATKAGLARQQFLESASVLAEDRWLEEANVVAEEPPYFSVTTFGFNKYIEEAVADYRDLYTAVAAQIVNGGKRSNHEIMQALGREDFLLIEHILAMMETYGLIRITRANGRHEFIHGISPRLGRILAES
jgi:TIR domain-containing protein